MRFCAFRTIKNCIQYKHYLSRFFHTIVEIQEAIIVWRENGYKKEIYYKLEMENFYDPYAVDVLSQGLEVGYIKKTLPSVPTHAPPMGLRIEVKAIE